MGLPLRGGGVVCDTILYKQEVGGVVRFVKASSNHSELPLSDLVSFASWNPVWLCDGLPGAEIQVGVFSGMDKLGFQASGLSKEVNRMRSFGSIYPSDR